MPGYDIPDVEVTRHRLLTMPIRTSVAALARRLPQRVRDRVVHGRAGRRGGRGPGRLPARPPRRPARPAGDRAGGRRWRAGARPAGQDAGLGIGYARYKGTSGYCAAVAEVEAGTEVRLRRLWLAVDVGRVINPDGVINQAEGGAVQSASWVLRERVRFDRAKITSVSWDSYPILRFTEVPDVTVRVIAAPGEPETGAGEVAQGPVAGAIGNAVAAAVGVRVRDLPLSRDQIIRAIGAG